MKDIEMVEGFWEFVERVSKEARAKGDRLHINGDILIRAGSFTLAKDQRSEAALYDDFARTMQESIDCK